MDFRQRSQKNNQKVVWIQGPLRESLGKSFNWQLQLFQRNRHFCWIKSMLKLISNLLYMDKPLKYCKNIVWLDETKIQLYSVLYEKCRHSRQSWLESWMDTRIGPWKCWIHFGLLLTSDENVMSKALSELDLLKKCWRIQLFSCDMSYYCFSRIGLTWMYQTKTTLLSIPVLVNTFPQTNDMDQWLQVELPQIKKITGIITQGAKSLGKEMYVISYTLQYSNDGAHWEDYTDDEALQTKVSYINQFTGN